MLTRGTTRKPGILNHLWLADFRAMIHRRIVCHALLGNSFSFVRASTRGMEESPSPRHACRPLLRRYVLRSRSTCMALATMTCMKHPSKFLWSLKTAHETSWPGSGSGYNLQVHRTSNSDPTGTVTIHTVVTTSNGHDQPNHSESAIATQPWRL